MKSKRTLSLLYGDLSNLSASSAGFVDEIERPLIPQTTQNGKNVFRVLSRVAVFIGLVSMFSVLTVKAQDQAQLLIPRYAPATATDGNFVYVYGGAPIGAGRGEDYLNSGVIGVYERIDPVSLDVKYYANGLYQRANHASVYMDGRIWSAGGRTQHGTMRTFIRDTENLTIGTDQHRPGPPLPIAVRSPALTSVDGKLYTFGGLHLNEDLPAVHTSRAFILESPYEHWRETESMPLALANCSIDVIGHEIYLIGGFDGSEAYAVTMIFDTRTENWRTGPPPPQPLSAHASVAIGSTIYTFGDYADQTAVYRFDTVREEWTKLDVPMTPRRHVRAEVAQGYVLVIGGNQKSEGAALGVIERYSVKELEAAQSKVAR